MAIFFRGAGIGSFWHNKNAQLAGFAPHSPGAMPSNSSLMSHIALASIQSPYVSFSRSFGIARAYALVGPGGMARPGAPGFVYEIEISDDSICRVLDPVVEIGKHLPS